MLDAMTDWRSVSGVFQGDSVDPNFPGSLERFHSVTENTIKVKNRRPDSPTGKLLIKIYTKGDLPKIRFIYKDGKKTLQVEKDFARLIGGVHRETPIVSMLYGNEHFYKMFGHMPPYDFYEESVPTYQDDPDVYPVDSAYIDSYIRLWAEKPFRCLSVIRKLTNARLLHVLPPPPRESPVETEYTERFGDLIQEYGFAPDHIRLKWYRRYTRTLVGMLEKIGCEVLVPPRESLTEGGLLKVAFADGLTHGNIQYGHLLSNDLMCWLLKSK